MRFHVYDTFFAGSFFVHRSNEFSKRIFTQKTFVKSNAIDNTIEEKMLAYAFNTGKVCCWSAFLEHTQKEVRVQCSFYKNKK